MLKKLSSRLDDFVKGLAYVSTYVNPKAARVWGWSKAINQGEFILKMGMNFLGTLCKSAGHNKILCEGKIASEK
jgi:hypothetical protein